ncbi:hypothetical protein ACFC5T_40110 [Streptomyces sp. NPDC055961]|uniref:hypothetical protein n=1 Tax=Streptomyces sp. NPDC055961 TaxID=3345666 RepID=UPI0035E2DD5E
MPRRQNTAAQRAREVQHETGTKYTAALREASKGAARVGTFSLQELLTECTTLPQWTGVHPEVDAEWAPKMFDSALLGGPVPYSAVLRLAGDLAGNGMSAEMRLESRKDFDSLVVACGARRFEFLLYQDDWVCELCRIPGCDRAPVSARCIPYCAGEHLAERSEAELVRMARDWGSDRREDCSRTPAAVDPGEEGDQLISAAIAQGVYAEVSEALLVSCYEERHMIEDVYWGETAMEVSHAMDREQLRMNKVAVAAAKRLQEAAGGHCACGAPLFPGAQRGVPTRFCSSTCAAAGER